MNQIAPFAAAPSFSMGDIKEVAFAIANGGLFGSRDPAAVLTLCLLAHAEGQHPAVVFRDYHIIQGKPAKKADAMLRDFVTAGGKVEWHQLNDEVADATFSHPGGGTARIDWTMKRAQTAGLSTPMWKKYPRQMLRSRVISEGVRTVYPGATSGLYEVGEVQDITGSTAEVPEQPAAEMAAIEHQPEPQQQTRQAPAPLTGPHKTRKALKDAINALQDEMNACDDPDQLDAFLAADAIKATVDQTREEHQFWWNGDGADFKGLDREIQDAYARVATSANEGWREDVTRAG